MDFQQSRTYSNLLNAYQQELKLSTFYLLNADQARLEGYMEIANIFDTSARNDKEHARIWQRKLREGILPDTAENLLNSANESENLVELYRRYGQIAREEGYIDIAALFNGIANIQLNHDLRFRTQHNTLIRGEEFCSPDSTLWICMQCGNIMSAPCAPAICPVCGFPQGYYRRFSNNP